jgi:hypothetical protein
VLALAGDHVPNSHCFVIATGDECTTSGCQGTDRVGVTEEAALKVGIFDHVLLSITVSGGLRYPVTAIS